MTQSEIDNAVAAMTGETLCTVQQRGFGIADPPDVNFDPEPYDRPPLLVDWDDVDAQRCALVA